MSVFRKWVFIGLCGALPISAAAEQRMGQTTIGAGVSIFGPLVEGTYMFEPNLRVRGVIIGGWDFDSSETDDNGNSFDLDIDPSAAAVLIDHYPGPAGLRFSGGVLFDMSELSAIGRPSAADTFEFNGETFDSGQISIDAGFASEVAPMVTVGYEYDFDDQLTLSGEIGAIYASGVNATATADNDELQNAIDNDADFQDALTSGSNVNILPYLSITMSYRF